MRLASGFACGLFLLTCGTIEGAIAQECTEAYTRGELAGHLGASQRALEAADTAKVIEVTAVIEDALPCLDLPIPRRVAPTVYRMLGAGRYFASDEEGAKAWFRTALVGESSGGFDADELPTDHPLRAVFEEARSTVAEPEPLDEMLVEGTWYLDGREFTSPVVYPGHYNLLQRMDDADVVSGWIADGRTWPDEVLESKRARRAREKGQQVEATGPVVIERARPKGQIPAIVAGSTIIAGSGGLLAANMLMFRRFETFEPQSSDEVGGSAVAVNSLAVASGVVFAAGAGTIGWGLSLNGGAHGTLRFRF